MKKQYYKITRMDFMLLGRVQRVIVLFAVLFLMQCASKPSISEEKTASLCSTVLISLNDIDKLPTPKRWNDVGNSHLALQNSAVEAQEWFDQSFNVLRLRSLRSLSDVVASRPH